MTTARYSSFKNVGVKKFDAQRVTTTTVSQTPIGIKTPVSFGTEALFEMNNTLLEQIEDNLRNLILTNHGERVMNYTFGANLMELLSEYRGQDAFEEEAKIRIKTAVTKYLPFIELTEFASALPRMEETEPNPSIEIYVKYIIPALGVTTDKTLKIVLTVMG